MGKDIRGAVDSELLDMDYANVDISWAETCIFWAKRPAPAVQYSKGIHELRSVWTIAANFIFSTSIPANYILRELGKPLFSKTRFQQ